ncbi:MAG: EF-P lysine aminoacylase GenX [Gammaproteobacteria bacterium]|nr:EF-P lysine aminoacylase GenX [Gammaproteobacteria bacterium]
MGVEQHWRPTATPLALQQRAALLRRLRRYFDQQQVLEVETPLLARGGTTDPHIPSYVVEASDGLPLYLNTSPEFAMKRLLAAGMGSIYQVCKAFRRGEVGRLHNPEFTLLEWYRIGFDHVRLMDDVAALVDVLAKGLREFEAPQRLSYQVCFQQYLNVDPHRASGRELMACAAAQGIGPVAGLALDDRDGWLDLLMSHCIQPQLGQNRLTFVYDYPATQASLARVRPGPVPVAERFELFIDGVELANGFHELRDANEQRQRFEADLRARAAQGLDAIFMDERLLAALEQGLPACAGVALGLDRLQLVLSRSTRLEEVQSFSFERI